MQTRNKEQTHFFRNRQGAQAIPRCVISIFPAINYGGLKKARKVRELSVIRQN